VRQQLSTYIMTVMEAPNDSADTGVDQQRAAGHAGAGRG
jgi:hypothetical protein